MDDPVVVVGLSFEFPQGANSTKTFFDILREGRCTMTEVPGDRFNIDAFYHPDPDRLDTLHSRGANFMERNLSTFDAPFFSMTPAEAECLDPQQRQLLETTYKALENAGIPLHRIAGSNTSVYVGSMAREYDALIQKDPERFGKYTATGTAPSMLANRLSWFYDLRGPSLTLDTACSSGLYALYLACQDLANNSTAMSIVGASNLILNPETVFIPLSNLGFLSPDSQCHSFTQKANGYARGEGVAVLVLKRLSQAIAAKDTIRAVIRGVHVNQDGKTPGITQPSLAAQKDLIVSCYRKAGLDLCHTKVFEAHGTGTTLGDSIEARAIHEVFRPHRPEDDPLIIGAVKSNIGHLEGASGLAGLIKSILILESGVIPPNASTGHSDPSVPAHHWGLQFPRTPICWPDGSIRRISINSFGFGGANAHAILDDARSYLESCSIVEQRTTNAVKGLDENLKVTPSINDSSPSLDTAYAALKPKVLVFSTNDRQGLERISEAYKQHFCNSDMMSSPQEFANMAYTLACRRTHFPWRKFVVARNLQEMLQGLSSTIQMPVRAKERVQCAFVFSGQGCLWKGMGQELFCFDVFNTSINRADSLLQRLGCSWFLRDVLRESTSVDVDHAAVAQPLCTALQIALVDLLRSWGIRPVAVVGHSSGEIAAAYTVGALNMEQALATAYFRGYHASDSKRSETRGSMLSIAASKTVVEGLCAEAVTISGDQTLTIGCYNSPTSVTVTGAGEMILSLMDVARQKSIFHKLLPIDVAYHSPKMHCIEGPYRQSLADFVFKNRAEDQDAEIESISMFSSVTGDLITTQELNHSSYWVKNLVSKVQFDAALENLCKDATAKLGQGDVAGKNSALVFIEIGPHASLRRPIVDKIHSYMPKETGIYDSVLKKPDAADVTALNLVGRLHLLGKSLRLDGVNERVQERKVNEASSHLPSYPFDHSKEHWLESRLSLDHRFRPFPRHDFLGVRCRDCNPLEPRWRNIITTREHPWIIDHDLGEVTASSRDDEQEERLYPFGGMLVMALEAARQLNTGNQPIDGFLFEDVRIQKALKVPLHGDAVESQLVLRPRQRLASRNTPKFDFTLQVFLSNNCFEIMTGSIAIVHETDETEVDHGEDKLHEARDNLDFYETIRNRCKTLKQAHQYYHDIQALGFSFGPTFQTLKEIKCSGDGAVFATLDLHANRARQPQYPVSDHVIHPSGLDAVFQLSLAAVSNGGMTRMPFMIPTQLRYLWISNKLSKHSEKQVQAGAEVAIRGLRDVEGRFVVLHPQTMETLIIGTQYQATALSTFDVANQSTETENRCYEMLWRPAVECLEASELHSILSNTGISSEANNLPLELLEAYCRSTIARVLQTVSRDMVPRSHVHLQRYYDWLQCCLGKISQAEDTSSCIGDSFIERSSDGRCQQKFDERLASVPEWRCYSVVGSNLSKLLIGEVDALDLLFRDHAVNDFYSGTVMNTFYQSMGCFAELLAFKCPTLRILEVGAGTGGASQHILSKLTEVSRDKRTISYFDEYWYTDVSPGFFEAATSRFGTFDGRLKYKVLNIELDPSAQGFQSNYFDVIVASSVIHATVNVERTLKNLATLLKPGGHLMVLEPAQPASITTNFCFGLLPGWWLAEEEERRDSPLMTETSWNSKFQAAGFESVEMPVQHKAEQGTLGFSLMVTTKKAQLKTGPAKTHITLVSDTDSVFQEQLRNLISQELLKHGDIMIQHVPTCDPVHVSTDENLIISLIDCELTAASFSDPARWALLKQLGGTPAKCLWLSRDKEECTHGPLSESIAGFARSVRSESNTSDFRAIIFSHGADVLNLARKTARIAASFSTSEAHADYEYRERDGIMLTNRVIEANHVNQFLEDQRSLTELHEQSVPIHSKTNYVLKIQSPGLLDSLFFQEEPAFSASIDESSVDLDVEAVGLNFKDVLIALGQVPEASFGQECSGIVTKAGPAVTKVAPGDRVFCCAANAFRTRIRAHSDTVLRVPDTLSFAEAAAIPIVFCTAYYALLDVARLRKGEKILIQSGAGGVGQAAVQLAQYIGAEIFITVGTDAKKVLMMNTYGIREDHIFYSRNKTFASRVKRATGHGVDVVLNALSGEFLEASWECIAPFGRFIEIGKKDILSNSKLSMNPFSRNVTFSSVDLGFIASNARSILARIITDVGSMLWQDPTIIRAGQPLHEFQLSQLEEAFRFLQSGQNSGKIVINMKSTDSVKIQMLQQHNWNFSPDAAYVIAGGLGGIGRSIARWMVSRGAKHLLLLSRSGDRIPEGTRLNTELKELGVNVHTPRCDISDENTLQAELERYQAIAPPIRGCIQGAMALKDRMLENMDIDDFEQAIKPKIMGSWNLHKHLPKGMDFFILLSSTGGVTGNRAQTNYAAGNTYQDGLARHRVFTGEKATSIDLSLVLGIGYAAERDQLAQVIRASGYEGTSEADIHALLEYWCNPAREIAAPDECQIIPGLVTPASLKRRGHEELYWMGSPLFQRLHQLDAEKAASPNAAPAAKSDLSTELKSAANSEEAYELILQGLADKLSKCLAVPVSEIDTTKPVFSFGVDSLIAVELRYWFMKEIKTDLGVMDIMSNNSMAELCRNVARQNEYNKPEATT